MGGLEKALLAQLVRGTGTLVRLGSRCLGWEAIATDFLELLVALASRGRGEVEEAIVVGWYLKKSAVCLFVYCCGMVSEKISCLFVYCCALVSEKISCLFVCLLLWAGV